MGLLEILGDVGGEIIEIKGETIVLSATCEFMRGLRASTPGFNQNSSQLRKANDLILY